MTTTTRYNAAALPLTSVQKQLISQLSGTIESKSVFVSERGLTSTQWTEYSGDTKRVQYSTVPTSSITAEVVTVDGFALSQKDTAGVATTFTRSYHTTQNIATRPLALQKDGTWYTYGWDLTKNICEVYSSSGYIRSSYIYTPYGLPSQSTNGAVAGGVEQPIQWSSEFNDTELGLVYYNYRHYNPVDGRWIGRDRIRNFKLYNYSNNNSIADCDYLGDFDYASAKVEYVYDSGVNKQWGRKVSAVTDINFPPIQVEKVPYEKDGNKFRFKFPEQKYVPTITCYKGAGCDERKLDEYIRDSVYPYTTIRKHELHHVDIACQYWNVFVF